MGVIIDDELSWKCHVDHVISKVSSGLTVSVLQNQLPDYVPKSIYMANVQSHLSYGISNWGPMMKKSQQNILSKQQIKCVHEIGNKCHENDLLFKK